MLKLSCLLGSLYHRVPSTTLSIFSLDVSIPISLTISSAIWIISILVLLGFSVNSLLNIFNRIRKDISWENSLSSPASMPVPNILIGSIFFILSKNPLSITPKSITFQDIFISYILLWNP
ncbi:hypothetical protein [Clostridium sp. Cult1]|uniref:hypothetical protein n=1 Tax=Clostridium sp. Cult1 TaxID=2079002 RepID=UPI003FA4809D